MGAAFKVFCSVALGLVFVAILVAVMLVQESQPTTTTVRGLTGDVDARSAAAAETLQSQSDRPVASAAGEKPRETHEAVTPGRPGGDAERMRAPQVDGVQSRLTAEPSNPSEAGRDLALARADLASMTVQIAEARLQNKTQQATVAASQEKLAEEQAKSARLDHDLAAARADLVGAETRLAASTQQDREVQQEGVALATRLAEEQARSAQLDQKLARAETQIAAAAQQQSTAQQSAAAAQAKLVEEQAKSAQLDHDLATARIDLASVSAQLNDVMRQQGDAAQAAEAQVRAAEEQRQRERQATMAADTKSDEAKRDVLSLQSQLRDAQEQLTRVTNELVATRTSLARAQEKQASSSPRLPDQPSSPTSAPIITGAQEGLQSSKAAKSQSATLSAPAPDAQGEATEAQPAPAQHPELQSGALAHVVLRYVRHNDKARARADALKVTLQDQGFAVADPIGTPFAAPVTKLSFFYQEDRAEAERLAGILAMPKPARGSVSLDDPLPRPGTIEIIVGG